MTTPDPLTQAIPRIGSDTASLPAVTDSGSDPRSFPAIPDDVPDWVKFANQLPRHANDPFVREPVSVPPGKAVTRQAIADDRARRNWLTAQKDEATTVVPGLQPCRCDDCKYGKRPGAGVTLYIGPDAIQLQLEQAHRDGRYEDIDAALDDVEVRAGNRITATERKARKAINRGWRQVSRVAATSANDKWLRDEFLGAQLRRIEDNLAAHLTAMKAEARAREAQLRDEAQQRDGAAA